ncbi:nucleotide sugar dehydrogenase [Bacillus cereus]|nr:nucleotide sugar dehydrogenase [Bacillus cereus]
MSMKVSEEDYYQELIYKIEQKSAVIGVIGLGYVGLPYAITKAMEGFRVIGFDLLAEKVNKINNAQNYIDDVDSNELTQVVRTNQLTGTTDFTRIKEIDIVFICVPTPIDKYKQPNLSYIVDSIETLIQYVKKGSLIMLVSTTYPGTTEEIIAKSFQTKGFSIGKDIFIAYTPERIDPSNSKFNVKNTRRVVGGMTEKCTVLATNVVGDMAHIVSSVRVAEMVKLHENTFRYINIALANELTLICNKLNINVWEVIEAAATKPYGFMPFYPCAGIGGHCIPVDPYYLSWKIREHNYAARMIETAGAINDNMPQYVVDKMIEILNIAGEILKNTTIVVLGITYKKDVRDTRESSSLRVIEILDRYGVKCLVCDPYVETYQVNQKKYETVPYTIELIKNAKLVLLATDHTDFEYQQIANHAKIIFDTRNAFQSITKFVGEYYHL